MRCTPGQQGRVLAERHQDLCPGAACTGCLPCPEDHCAVCRRDHATGTCPDCLALARQNLLAIVDLTTHLSDEAVHGRASVKAELPGGDALVLLAPGNYRATGWHDPQANGLRPPVVVLDHWAYWWASQHHHAQPAAPGLGWLHQYLDRHLHTMAADPAFPRLARDLVRVRAQLENVLYDGERPEVSRVPCWECGTRLVKVYGHTEREDHWVCPRCKEVYDKGRYDRAKHDHLASKGADRYVSVPDAVAAVGRPEQTVRTWMRNHLVAWKRDPKTGRVFVWWPDVREQHLVAGRRNRKAG